MIVTLKMTIIVRVGGFLGTKGMEDRGGEDGDGDELVSCLSSWS